VRVSTARAYTAESQECLQKVPLPCAYAYAWACRRRLSLCRQLRRLKFGWSSAKLQNADLIH
jgi:hypothetical protein